jgi:hypothetical protein
MSNDISQEHVVETEVVGDQVVQRETVGKSDPDKLRSLNKMIQVIYYIEGIVMALLGLRFVLRMFGASAASSFVNFLYTITYPFVAPFFGMFQTSLRYGTARLEFETLIGMAVYAILFWIIIGLMRVIK